MSIVRLMPLSLASLLLATLLLVGVPATFAQESAGAPTRFDIAIDGEVFTVDANRTAELKSQKKPGVTYRVAVRAAEYQPWKLNTVAFDYHRGFHLADDRTAKLRTATLQHRLGFTLAIGDLGAPQTDDEQRSTLDRLTTALEQSIRDSGGSNIAVNPPKQSKYGATAGLGVLFDYDLDGESQRSLVLVLANKDAAVSAILHYPENEQANILPIIRPTFESIRPLAKR